jgi:hypothetical protein
MCGWCDGCCVGWCVGKVVCLELYTVQGGCCCCEGINKHAHVGLSRAVACLRSLRNLLWQSQLPCDGKSRARALYARNAGREGEQELHSGTTCAGGSSNGSLHSKPTTAACRSF